MGRHKTSPSEDQKASSAEAELRALAEQSRGGGHRGWKVGRGEGYKGEEKVRGKKGEGNRGLMMLRV